MSAVFTELQKTVAVAGTPEVFGASTVLFSWGMFFPLESNTGNVAIRPAGSSTGWNYVQPGETPYRANVSESGAVYSASDFEIDAAVAGEGFRLVYCYPNPKSFSDIECRLEDAMLIVLQTLAITIDDDCTFTTGISDNLPGPDNIHCSVEGSDEEVKDTGLWRCHCTVVVKTGVGGNAEERGTNIIKHRLRTSYVRDLFRDTNVHAILSAVSPLLTVQPGGIDKRTTSSGVSQDDRKYISRMSFDILCCANQAFA